MALKPGPPRQDIHNSGTPVICRSCEARHKGMCGALNAEELTELARHTRLVRRDEGTALVDEGSPVTSYANIMRGVVKLTQMLEDGRVQIVGLQFAPDLLGRLFGSQSTVTAEAATDVELCKVPKAALERLIAENPALEHRLMQQTLRELDEARAWMMTLGRKSAREKVASFLMLVANYLDPEESVADRRAFDLPLSRQEIADFLGLTIETVSRQLTALREAGVITMPSRRRVEVPSVRGLKLRCG